MKYRSSFVTNSSSSSYTCNICGEDASGWDLCLSEAEMVECINGHTLCEEHIDNKILDSLFCPDTESGMYIDDAGNEIDPSDIRYEFPEKFCPICRFDKLQSDDIINYLIKYQNLDIEKLRTEIKEKFSSYSDFIKKISE